MCLFLSPALKSFIPGHKILFLRIVVENIHKPCMKWLSKVQQGKGASGLTLHFQMVAKLLVHYGKCKVLLLVQQNLSIYK